MERGFSLLELLLVIAIGVILASLSAPLAIQFYENQLVTDASKQIQDTLDMARTFSVTNLGDAPHGLFLVPASHQYTLFQGESYVTRDVGEDQVYDFPASVTVTATSTEVVFSRLYGTSTIDEVWAVHAGTFFRNIRIHSSGNVERE